MQHSLQDLEAFLNQQNILVKAHIISKDTPIASARDNSQLVDKNDVFFCKGQAFKATYLADALNKNASAWICDESLAETLCQKHPETNYFIVSDMRQALALVSRWVHNECDKNLCICGITGTKGKSTTTYMLRSIFDAASTQKSCAVLSSINVFDGGEECEAHNTTPEAPELWQHFENACTHGLKHLVMEVSSQALKYHRTLGTHFAYGCFLNIARDHISDCEHPSFEDYFSSKLKLFSQSQTAIYNLNTDHIDEVKRAAQQAQKAYSFSIDCSDADVWATDIVQEHACVRFVAHTPDWQAPIEMYIPGLFNVENALCAITVAWQEGISVAQIQKGLKECRVPGRMEIITTHIEGLEVLVDYAHNQLSFEALFSSLQKMYPTWNISAVFGCAGGKAVDRIKDLPQTAARWCQHIIYTMEDPGPIDAEELCQKMFDATPQEYQSTCKVIVDREQAVTQAILDAYASDTPTLVCLLAKGDETDIHIGSRYVPYASDPVVAKRVIAKLEESK